ncbi:molybdopterin-dependent oxidoreductase [Acidianus sulfidivorans JP7]|uniref:Xanthine dehydrogenase family protein molybdopterin-binding subunit n=1 Tax=Acidianus sulfidivorans JP7 TaxID=619593 RepID=A0A2U9INB9_9CREN|nr:glyceraldehyde dehydrogenase subunit alpha [Acidianus sulfidivorans]AWR97511.1 molybdopterin-dependent oxidoreductase [Acidianus sulfidivorans JP7]
MKYIGKPIKRIEDPRLISGKGTYVDDIKLPGEMFVAFLRSTKPHARIKIKKTEGVFTGEDINPGKDFPIPTKETTYVGQPIACVIAKDRYEAYDLLENIEVEYEELPYVLDPYESIKDEIKVYSKLSSNIYFKEVYSDGEPEKVLKESQVIEGELINQRMIASPLETRGIVSFFDGQRLTVWSSTQSAHFLRRNLVNFLGFSDIRVIQPDVGGAFGSKIITHPEEYAVAKLAIQLRVPLKWIPTRTEEMISAGHGRDKKLKFKVGFTRDGVITSLVGTLVGDLGAPYADANDDEGGNVKSTARMILGPYKIRNAMISAYAVHTNKVPTTSYRGAGRPEATYFIERIINMIGNELGIDPIEIRLRNVIKPEEMPYKNAFGITYDSGDYPRLLNEARTYYNQLLSEAKNENGCVGVAMYVEITGFGPWEVARVFAKSDGKIIAITGSGPHGQGDATGFAQIVAETLQIPIESVEVRWGDTDIIEDGIGTWGSRTITVGGSAIMKAAEELKQRIISAAAKMLNADVEELQYEEGGKITNKKSGKSVSLNEVISFAYKNGISLDVTSVYPVSKPTSPYGVHMALVNIDKDLGKINVKKYIALDDIGKVINPLTAGGQVHGGVVQGIAQALYEEAIIDNQGNLLNPNLNDYGFPTAVESPEIIWEYREIGLSSHPTGSKGVGEAGAVVSTPVIVNAVENCIKKRIFKIPIKLSEL